MTSFLTLKESPEFAAHLCDNVDIRLFVIEIESLLMAIVDYIN